MINMYSKFNFNWLVCFLVLLPFISAAQKENSEFELDLTSFEDILLENTDSNDPDLVYFYETLRTLSRNPLNLNEATYEELKELPLLNELQVQQLVLYKSNYGKLISIYELQSIPSFDLKTIRAILPFVKISGERLQMSIPEMVKGSDQFIVMKWGRVLQERAGYQIDEGDDAPAYEGSPDQLILRYLGNYENKFRYGFLAEKDAGESFFRKSNPQGFDYMTGHVFLKDYSKFLKAIALGDYQVSFGQGLIAYSGFSGNKGANVMGIERSRRTLRYSASLNETLFLRGAGVTLGVSDNIEITAFGSSRKTDGNVIDTDSILAEFDLSDLPSFTTSIINSGNHRTVSEIEDEGKIRVTNFGGNVKYKKDNFSIAFNSIVHQLDQPLIRNDEVYNQFTFSGDQLVNFSTDYNFFIRNFNFFGETGWSDNGSVATVNGLLIGLDEKISLSLLHRYLPPDFQTLNSRVFAETTAGNNENGLYLGLEANPSKNWNFRAYFDTWQHPWLRSTVDAPSIGREYFARITYKKKRRSEIYFQLRNEVKQRNATDDTAAIDYLTPNSKTYFRVHVANKISKSIEIRSRAEWSFFDNQIEEKEQGYLLYQDVIFKSISSPISITTRFAIFDATWNTRFFAYENDLLYTFYIPPYYRKGTRFYVNLRYRPTKNWTMEMRYERTFINNETSLSSGNQEIIGNVQSALEAQVRYSF